MDKYVLIIPLALLGLAGCDQPMAQGYSQTSSASQQQNVQYGTVLQVRTVQVQTGANNQVAGAVMGGIAGAVVGNQFGKGTGKDLMTGAGAVGGAVLGAQVAGAPTLRMSQEWTVRLDSGLIIKVIQDNAGFRVGQRVQFVQTHNGAYLAA